MLRAAVLLWVCLEITGFIGLGNWLGLGWTLLLTIASMGVGILLLRQQGFRAANVMMQKMRTGELASTADFKDMPFLMLGAILLIIPGFFSDILGLLCFLPPIQRYVVKLLTRATRRHHPRVHERHYVNQGRTFEGDYAYRRQRKKTDR